MYHWLGNTSIYVCMLQSSSHKLESGVIFHCIFVKYLWYKKFQKLMKIKFMLYVTYICLCSEPFLRKLKFIRSSCELGFILDC
jgi:hypothetical protein